MESLFTLILAWFRVVIGASILYLITLLVPAMTHGTGVPGIVDMVAAVAGVSLIAIAFLRDYLAAQRGAPRSAWNWLMAVGGYLAVGLTVLHSVGSTRVDSLRLWAIGFAALALGTKVWGGRRMLLDRAPRRAPAAAPAQSAPAVTPAAAAQPEPMRGLPATQPKKTFADIGGMRDLKATLARVILPFRAYNGRNSEISDRNGVLLSGPPGNGKTMVAEAIAGELGFSFVKATVGDMTSKWVNQSADEIQAVFDSAIAAQPCVLFLDEIDAVARSRDAGGAHGEDIKVVNALLTQIDRIRQHRVLLVAATNYPDAIDAAIMRDGRFDFRIEVPYPDYEARLAILKDVAARYGVLVSDTVAAQAASRWERRSAAFIDGVMKRVRDDVRAMGKRFATLADLKKADRETSRSAGALPTNGAKLSELHLPEATMIEAKSLLERLRHWDETVEQGGTPPRGVLVYGPPGTGKTNLVRAVARELGDWHMFCVRASEILADPRKFTAVIEKAAQHRPAFVFIDEAEELLKDRSFSGNAAATNEILTAMDGMLGAVPEVVFVAATNHADAIDAAAKRGGRFDEKIYMGPFAGDDLRTLIERDLARRPNFSMDADLGASRIAEILGECTPADTVAILNKAINYTFVNGSRRPLAERDVRRAIEQISAV
jgi:transitional endoplasmic reticulum ATPase